MPGGPLSRSSSPYGGPRRGPRSRRESVQVSGRQIPPPLEAVAGKTIRIPFGAGKAARVQAVGLDALERLRDLEHEIFIAQDRKVFTCSFERETGIVLLTPVGVGTSTLGVQGDAYIGEGEILLTDELTVEVYPIATQLRLYYQPAGAPREVLLPAEGGAIDLRLSGGTARVRVEGVDALGNVVPLQSQVFSTASNKFHIDPATPPLAGTAVLVPDTLTGFIENFLDVTADGDPSDNVAPLSFQVLVRVLDTLATHFGFSSALENQE